MCILEFMKNCSQCSDKDIGKETAEVMDVASKMEEILLKEVSSLRTET